MAVERVARPVERDIVGQGHRQVRLGHRHRAAGLAVDDRNRAAPVSLAADSPVAQAEIDFALTLTQLLDPVGHGGLGLLDGHPVQETRINHPARAKIGFRADVEGCGVLVRRADHRHHVEPIFAGEIKVALVVRRAAEDRAGAVIHQDEVGDIDRQFPIRIKGVDHLKPGVEALLLGLLQLLFRGAHPAAFGIEFG